MGRPFFSASKLTPVAQAYKSTKTKIENNYALIITLALTVAWQSVQNNYEDKLKKNHATKNITSLLLIQTFLQRHIPGSMADSASVILNNLREMDQLITDSEHLLDWKDTLIHSRTLRRIENFFKMHEKEIDAFTSYPVINPPAPEEGEKDIILFYQAAKIAAVECHNRILNRMLDEVNAVDAEKKLWAMKEFDQEWLLSVIVEEMNACLKRVADTCQSETDSVPVVMGKEGE